MIMIFIYSFCVCYIFCDTFMLMHYCMVVICYILLLQYGLMAGHSSVIVSQIKTEDPSDVSSGSLCPSSPHIYSPSNSGLSNGQTDFSHRIMGPVVGSTKSHCQSPEQMTLVRELNI